MKTIAVFDKRGKRAPLVWALYNYLRHEYNILYIDALDQPAEKSIRNLIAFTGGKCDGIIWGFGHGTALGQSAEWLNSEKIPILISVADPPQFCTRPGVTEQFWGLENIVGVIYKGRVLHDDDALLRNVAEKMAKGWTPVGKTADEYGDAPRTFLSASILLLSPWALNHESVYANRKFNPVRNIDVAHICTITPLDPNHMRRQAYRSVIDALPGSIVRWTKPVYSDQYYDTLARSKICVIDSNDTGFVTQKYVEAAIYGCMVIGDLPRYDPVVFKDGESMAAANPGNLQEKVLYYAEHDAEREYIAEELRTRIIMHYNLDAAIYPIVNILGH